MNPLSRMMVCFGLALVPPACTDNEQSMVAQVEGDDPVGGPASFGEIDTDAESHGEGLGWSFWPILAQFIGLMWLIAHYGKKPVSQFLNARRASIEHGLEEAAQMKRQAEAKYREYAGRLEKLDEELDALRAEMIKAGEAERNRIVTEAESKAARMRKDAEFMIAQQMKQLRIDLTREAVDAAIGAAERVLKERTTSADHERLARDYLGRLAKGPP